MTLGDRFAMLPAELRADVFAHLLVRPVKWDTAHLPRSECLIDSFERHHQATSMECIWPCSSGYGDDARAWRRLILSAAGAQQPQDEYHRIDWAPEEPPVTVALWHSSWAPEPRNKLLCSECYERKYRSDPPAPRRSLRSLPCLCARRADLQVLLVCRQWYDEAGMVFYTRNTFAFAHPHEVLGFVGALADRWRRVLARVSFMVLATAGGADRPQTAHEEIAVTGVIVRTPTMGEAWRLMARELTGLKYLEVDAILLAREESATMLRGVEFENLRVVRFVQAAPHMWQGWSDMDERGNRIHMWPRISARRNIDGRDDELAADVARAMKGLKHDDWEETSSMRVRQAMHDEMQKYLKRFPAVELDDA